MDYAKKITVTSILLGVLTLTALLGWIFSQQSVAQRQAAEPLLTGFQTSAVTGLEIGTDIVLAKNGTAWTLTYQGKAYPPSADRAETYLKTLAGLTRDRLVTTSSDVASFGLDKDFKTLKVLGTAGKVLADLQVGNANDQGTKVWVRFAGQKEVWETDVGFSRTLGMDFNTWADLSIFPGKKAGDLTRIAFDSKLETPDKTVYAPFDLNKSTKDKKTVWENRITKASTDTMASWADLVPTFHVAAFASPADGVPPATTLGTVTLTWSDGSTDTLKIGPADAQNRYRVTSGTKDVWVNDWALGQLLYK
jgi:hypothetical protein